MNTVGTPLLWGGFAVVVAIMLAIDLLLQGRRGAHAMTMKQAAAWSLVWVTLSLLFIGIKMLIVDFYHIPIAVSLGVVFGILVMTFIINAWVNYRHDKQRGG